MVPTWNNTLNNAYLNISKDINLPLSYKKFKLAISKYGNLSLDSIFNISMIEGSIISFTDLCRMNNLVCSD